jgi:hypothetical protein
MLPLLLLVSCVPSHRPASQPVSYNHWRSITNRLRSGCVCALCPVPAYAHHCRRPGAG